MSQKISNRRTIRELAPAEMEQVGGGLYVHGPGKVIVKQPLPLGVAVKRASNLAARVLGKI